MNWIIYCHTNKINNKKYIGLTKKTIIARWKLHCSNAFNEKNKNYNVYFMKAIRKYGKDNWSGEILQDSIISIEQANEAEIKWIAHYNSTNKKFGYNISEGGNSGSHHLGNTFGIGNKSKIGQKDSEETINAKTLRRRNKHPKDKNKYLGVRKIGNKFAARIMFKHKEIYIGLYKTEEEAAKERDKKAIELLGEYAVLNFK